MMVRSLESILLDLPQREAFVAGHGRTERRRIAVVRIDTDLGVGWGECSALPEPTYTPEWADGAFRVIIDRLAPLVVGREFDADPPLLAGSQALAGLEPVAANPMAKAAIEMAVIDAVLRYRGLPLARALGVDRTSVPAGVSLGLDTVAATAERCRGLAERGYRRLKLKIVPGHDVDLVTAVRANLGDLADSVELHVDGNGGYPPGAVQALAGLADRGVIAIEQPFPADDLKASAALVAELERLGAPTRLVADEAVETGDDLGRLIDAGAITGVSIKPPRVGGIAAAVDMAAVGAAVGLAVTAGGMLETGLGRRSLAAVAALSPFDLTGDLSPAGRLLAEDPWPDLTITDGTVEVPTDPGVGPDPDPEALTRFTVDRGSVTDPEAEGDPLG